MTIVRATDRAKVFTLRHFLFYMGVAAVLGVAIGAARILMGWSDGLTFSVALVAGTVAATMAVREDLFGSSPRAHVRRDHHA
jgi:uncharacterized membrane protein YhiD involved in acid resistance